MSKKVEARLRKLTITEMKEKFAKLSEAKDEVNYINKENMTKYLKSCGIDSSYFKGIIKKFDKNQDSLISWEEFIDYVLVGDTLTPMKIQIFEQYLKLPKCSTEQIDTEVEELAYVFNRYNLPVTDFQLRVWIANSINSR
ncbi:hypothetical protein Ciccas_013773 [Cichlidogyrus casuarinus]|uniref:EF-hand domain-containing protein n=1 Tax=Cichlidogyrus casuarinus TaxID=1844966 RepID=A0ABD2PKZ4_9PLAT